MCNLCRALGRPCLQALFHKCCSTQDTVMSANERRCAVTGSGCHLDSHSSSNTASHANSRRTAAISSSFLSASPQSQFFGNSCSPADCNVSPSFLVDFIPCSESSRGGAILDRIGLPIVSPRHKAAAEDAEDPTEGGRLHRVSTNSYTVSTRQYPPAFAPPRSPPRIRSPPSSPSSPSSSCLPRPSLPPSSS